VEGTPNIVQWSDAYKASLIVPQGQEATPAQWNSYNHRREYHLPVFNRGQTLKFNYLCTRPNDDNVPGVFIDTQLKGAKLKYQARLNFVMGVPIQIAALRGLLISLVVLGLSAWKLHQIWATAAICMIVGLFAQALGAVEYKCERWLRNLVIG
jgi:hypothetical protein